MSPALSTAAIVCGLALAAWGLLAFALNRNPDRAQLAGTAVLTVAVLALIVSGLVNWEPAEPVTFIGYALSTLLLPVAAWVLAKMEPTRFGSLIVGVGALIVPVLVLRMGQVWGAS
jgi:4-amino-4-deoxy-L-arabinose transferase-like glycosyltransferase